MNKICTKLCKKSDKSPHPTLNVLPFELYEVAWKCHISRGDCPLWTHYNSTGCNGCDDFCIVMWAEDHIMVLDNLKAVAYNYCLLMVSCNFWCFREMFHLMVLWLSSFFQFLNCDKIFFRRGDFYSWINNFVKRKGFQINAILMMASVSQCLDKMYTDYPFKKNDLSC